MKRSPLLRKSPLKRQSALRVRRKPSEDNVAKRAYKEVMWGVCECCGTVGWIRRHHVVREQDVRALGGDCWSQRNAMWVGAFDWVCLCHRRHHNPAARGDTRIPLPLVSDTAVAWAVELFGSDERAAWYLARHYRPELP